MELSIKAIRPITVAAAVRCANLLRQNNTHSHVKRYEISNQLWQFATPSKRRSSKLFKPNRRQKIHRKFKKRRPYGVFFGTERKENEIYLNTFSFNILTQEGSSLSRGSTSADYEATSYKDIRGRSAHLITHSKLNYLRALIKSSSSILLNFFAPSAFR